LTTPPTSKAAETSAAAGGGAAIATADAGTHAAGPTPAVSTVRFLHETGLAAEFAHIAEPVLESMGFRLVRVLVTGATDRIVQIMAERPDGSINVDDCEQISKGLSPVLDVADPLDGKYRLEISSPGIDRPLVRPSDFEDWSGHEARIETKEPVDGRKRFKGLLEGFEDGEVRIAADAGKLGIQHLGFPIHLIEDAKLVLNDELIRDALTRAKERHSAKLGALRPGDGAELDETDLEEKIASKKHATKNNTAKKHAPKTNTPKKNPEN
jgi:ribosome maturation factor RimP